MADKPQKSIGVYDIDGTVLDHFEVLCKAAKPVIEAMAVSRGMTPDEFKKAAQDWCLSAPEKSEMFDRFSHAYNDPSGYLSVVPAFQPPQAGDERFSKMFKEKYAAEMRFFPDVQESFKAMTLDQDGERNGVNLVLLTDGTRTAVRERLAFALKHADEAGGLPEGKKFMDMVDGLYCQPDPDDSATPAMPVEDPELAPYFAQIDAKMHVLPPGTAKPDPTSLAKILQDFDRAPEEAFMCGDGHVDMGTGNRNGVDTVWQYDGCNCSAEAIAYNDAIGNPGYKIGVEPVGEKMKAKGEWADHVAEGGVSDINRMFDMKSERPHQAPDLGTTVEVKATQGLRARASM